MAQLRTMAKLQMILKLAIGKKHLLASGGTNADYNIFGNNFSLTAMGGYDNDTRGNQVHIPPWLKMEILEMLLKD